LHECEWHKKYKIYDEKKLNKWHTKTNKTNHNNIDTSHGAYIGLYQRIRLYDKPHKWD
jgi:hypothetical protein